MNAYTEDLIRQAHIYAEMLETMPGKPVRVKIALDKLLATLKWLGVDPELLPKTTSMSTGNALARAAAKVLGHKLER